jgi:hypothetical protein
MTKNANRTTISLLYLAAILGSASVAYADPVLTTPRGVTLQKPAVRATATVNGQVRAHNAPANVSLTNAAALSSFFVKFDNGDHALRSLSLAKQSDQTAGLWMSDSNSDDPITATGTWWVIPGATGGQVTTSISSGQEINLTVPTGPANHRLVLGGFSFYVEGSSNNFEPGEMQIGRIAIRATDPHPAASNSAASRISGTVFTNDGNRRINVTVQYVWVPDSYIVSSGSVRHDSTIDQARAVRPGFGVRSIAKAVGQMPSSKRYLIKSFDFEYTNGTHNMLGFGVHLTGTPSAQTEAITWQDNNRDDPIAWNVSYLMMP